MLPFNEMLIIKYKTKNIDNALSKDTHMKKQVNPDGRLSLTDESLSRSPDILVLIGGTFVRSG